MSIYDFKVKNKEDEEINLKDYKGKVLIIVNTATGCGFTPQYEALEKLYQKYHKKGLEILDFPCDQFGHQAPGTDDEIHEFCTSKYNTSFDRFKKIEVNGENELPLFKYIKDNSPKEILEGLKNKMAMSAVKKISTTCKKENDIIWNFTKFIIDKEGNIVARYSPIEDPMKMEKTIIELLG
ncbi:MAG: glutathione peroxidase [Bacilli bacterium]|nr:glutathione peroxidase [Bacilli bacterium]